jgi:3-hydroxyisobutyrate dehydrogenase-like beta-hydroxyacid dehydrogenase
VSKQKLAFIGLGVMGFPMAGHLAARGGHDVTVFNRGRAKAEAWVAKHGGRLAETPAKAADGASIVFSCVGDDPDLREVTLGSGGAFDNMAKGAIFVDHTTASAKVARELSADSSSSTHRCRAARRVPTTVSSPSWLAATPRLLSGRSRSFRILRRQSR